MMTLTITTRNSPSSSANGLTAGNEIPADAAPFMMFLAKGSDLSECRLSLDNSSPPHATRVAEEPVAATVSEEALNRGGERRRPRSRSMEHSPYLEPSTKGTNPRESAIATKCSGGDGEKSLKSALKSSRSEMMRRTQSAQFSIVATRDDDDDENRAEEEGKNKPVPRTKQPHRRRSQGSFKVGGGGIMKCKTAEESLRRNFGSSRSRSNYNMSASVMSQRSGEYGVVASLYNDDETTAYGAQNHFARRGSYDSADDGSSYHHGDTASGRFSAHFSASFSSSSFRRHSDSLEGMSVPRRLSFPPVQYVENPVILRDDRRADGKDEGAIRDEHDLVAEGMPLTMPPLDRASSEPPWYSAEQTQEPVLRRKQPRRPSEVTAKTEITRPKIPHTSSSRYLNPSSSSLRGGMERHRLNSSCIGASESDPKAKKSVGFDLIQIREYARELGDNPSVSNGPPISISWDYDAENFFLDLELFESIRPPRRYHSEMVMPRAVREHVLIEWGHTRTEIAAAVRTVQRSKSQRLRSVLLRGNLASTVEEALVDKVGRSFGKLVQGTCTWSWAGSVPPPQETPVNPLHTAFLPAQKARWHQQHHANVQRFLRKYSEKHRKKDSETPIFAKLQKRFARSNRGAGNLSEVVLEKMIPTEIKLLTELYDDCNLSDIAMSEFGQIEELKAEADNCRRRSFLDKSASTSSTSKTP